MKSSRLIIKSGGNIGIGTTNPTYKLDVVGPIGVDSYIRHNDDADTYLFLQPDRIMAMAGNEWLLELYEGTQDYVKLGDGGDVDINLNDDVFVEGSSGNVGIGTTSPLSTFHVHDVDNKVVMRMTTPNTGITTSDGLYIGVPSDNNAYWWNYENTATVFANNNSEKMRIDNDGNVGIGTTNPQGKLDIAGQYGSDIYVVGASGASKTIDWNNGNTQHITLTANCTLTFSNGISGRKYTLIVKQDATGLRTITWPATARWSGGTTPTLTTTANKTDYVGFIYNSVDSKYDGLATKLNF